MSPTPQVRPAPSRTRRNCGSTRRRQPPALDARFRLVQRGCRKRKPRTRPRGGDTAAIMRTPSISFGCRRMPLVPRDHADVETALCQPAGRQSWSATPRRRSGLCSCPPWRRTRSAPRDKCSVFCSSMRSYSQFFTNQRFAASITIATRLPDNSRRRRSMP